MVESAKVTNVSRGGLATALLMRFARIMLTSVSERVFCVSASKGLIMFQNFQYLAFQKVVQMFSKIKLAVAFLLLVVTFASAQATGVVSAVSASAAAAQSDFEAIISVVVPVVFVIVVAVAAIVFGLRLFRNGSNLRKDGTYKKSWNWEGHTIKTDKDFYAAWEKKYGAG